MTSTNLTEYELKFIDIFFVRQKSISETSKILNISQDDVRKLKNDLKERASQKLKVRNKWKSKKIGGNFEDFYTWYEETEKKCLYCNVTQDELDKLHEIGIHNKRPTRGRTLEIDRKHPDKPYHETENLTFSCYWCNNAKTDTFSVEEFIIIGKAISEVWQNRIKIYNEKQRL